MLALLMNVLSLFQEFEVSGKKLYLNFNVRVGITSSRSVRVARNLRTESRIYRLESGVK